MYQTTGKTTGLNAFHFRQPTNNQANTAATLSRMAKIAKAWKREPLVISTARNIIANIPGKQFKREAEALQNWVRSNVRYTKDVAGVETLQTPEVTLKVRQGDCDDHSILLAALLSAVGHPSRFRAVKIKGNGIFCHVFTETKIGNQWFAVETTEPWPLGFLPDPINLRESIIRYV